MGNQQRGGGQHGERQGVSVGRTTLTRMAWNQLGGDDAAVWGRYQGSGASPYLVAVLRSAPATSTCSCPSRRLPCKHAADLAQRLESAQIRPGSPPDFVTAWIDRRAAREQQAEARPAGELADPDAAVKRAAERMARVTDGLDELDRWMHDQIRAGLGGLQQSGYAAFDAVAARMVDAQAPGVAGLLRAMPGEMVGDGWPGRLLDQFGLLHLLIAAHRRLADLPPGLAATVRSRVGYPVAKDDVLRTPGVSDHWCAVGMVETIEYPVESRRVWLYGAETGEWALLLSFAPPGGYLSSEAAPGDQLRARLHRYPGSGQFRALVGARTGTDQPPSYPPAATLAEVQQRFAALLADDPWAGRMPAVVAGVPIRPSDPQRPWLLRDRDGIACELTGLTADPWPLLAAACSGEAAVFGEWSGRGLRPLSVLPGADGLGFTAQIEGRAA